MSLELLQKAETVLANITAGNGLLNAEQSDKFIDEIIDSPTVLKICRTVPMPGPTMEISSLGFGSRVTRQGASGVGLEGVALTNDSSATTSIAAPQMRTILLSTKLYKAQTSMTYEVLEDNIARGTFEQAILRQFTKAVSRDMEEIVLRGDSASGDAYLATLNGVVKRVTTNSVNATTTGNTPTTYSNAVLALADRFKSDMSSLRFIVTPTMEQNYRLAIAGRQTALGDSAVAGHAPMQVMGVPIVKANYMPSGTGVLIDPYNIIVGMQRNIRIESFRDVLRGVIHYVVSFRMDVQLDNEAAAVKIVNVA